MKNIFFPTDLSELSLKALPLAISLTKKFDGHLHFIHVIDLREYFLLQDYFHDNLAGVPVLDDSYKQLELRVETFKEKIISQGLNPDKVHCQHIYGEAVDQILKYSKDESIDLIVMSTHGYSGFERIFMGSVTNRLLHESYCPILTLNPATLKKDANLSINHVCFPTDFSEMGDKALNVAHMMSKKYDASLKLVHVLNDVLTWPVFKNGSVMQGLYGSFENVYKESKAIVNEKLKRYEKKIKENDVSQEISLDVLKGVTEEALLQCCQTIPGSCMVMSTHGRKGLNRLMIGSVAERIVQTANFPVLIVNPKKNESLSRLNSKYILSKV